MEKKMKTGKALLILIIVLLIQNFGTYSKESPTRVEITLADRLQRVLDTSREEHSVKGISAALKIPGQETLLLTSGLSEDSIPITSDMIF